MDELRALGCAVLVVVMVFTAVVGMSMLLEITYEQNYCKTMITLNPDFEFQWELWGGCLVQTPSGYWIHASEYKYLEGDITTENK